VSWQLLLASAHFPSGALSIVPPLTLVLPSLLPHCCAQSLSERLSSVLPRAPVRSGPSALTICPVSTGPKACTSAATATVTAAEMSKQTSAYVPCQQTAAHRMVPIRSWGQPVTLTVQQLTVNFASACCTTASKSGFGSGHGLRS
jgi:hypothetical protein